MAKRPEWKLRPNRLRKYRRINELSQLEVARIMEVKGSGGLSRWEHGKVLPNLMNAIKLSVIYHTFTDSMFRDQFDEFRKEYKKRVGAEDKSPTARM